MYCTKTKHKIVTDIRYIVEDYIVEDDNNIVSHLTRPQYMRDSLRAAHFSTSPKNVDLYMLLRVSVAIIAA